MKNGILLIVWLLFASSGNAQLNCSSTVNADKSTTKLCLHANKKVATSESWDEVNRFGTLIVFNNQGKELVRYNLRKVGGHASAHLTYFPNGQVAKIEFSDAPDGGIQFYESKLQFDENGNQIDFYETKYPFQLETTFVQVPEKTTPVVEQKPKIEPKKEEVIACASINTTIYQLKNTTSSRVRISIVPVKNNSVTVSAKEIVLKPNETIAFDTIIMADQFVTAKVYQPVLVQIETKKRKNSTIRIAESSPIDVGAQRIYDWFIVKDQ